MTLYDAGLFSARFYGNLRLLITLTGKGNDELLDGASRIQDQTFESLTRTQLMINNSKEVGAATIEGLIRACLRY